MASIDDGLRRLSPKSNIAKALVYGRKRWGALSRSLDEGSAEIDKNIGTAGLGLSDIVMQALKAGHPRARYRGDFGARPLLFLSWRLPESSFYLLIIIAFR